MGRMIPKEMKYKPLSCILSAVSIGNISYIYLYIKIICKNYHFVALLGNRFKESIIGFQKEETTTSCPVFNNYPKTSISVAVPFRFVCFGFIRVLFCFIRVLYCGVITCHSNIV